MVRTCTCCMDNVTQIMRCLVLNLEWHWWYIISNAYFQLIKLNVEWINYCLVFENRWLNSLICVDSLNFFGCLETRDSPYIFSHLSPPAFRVIGRGPISPRPSSLLSDSDLYTPAPTVCQISGLRLQNL